jgi:hypothetical protein
MVDLAGVEHAIAQNVMAMVTVMMEWNLSCYTFGIVAVRTWIVYGQATLDYHTIANSIIL